MNPKTFLKNKSICALPWTGFELEPNGGVKNCIIAKNTLGNINTANIKDIMSGDQNVNLKKAMLQDQKPSNCQGCYHQEKNTNDLSSISSRLYYLKGIVPNTDLKTFDDVKNFTLKHVDLRWTNSCNQACVYCMPEYSSKWAQELGVKVKSNKEARDEVKQFVFENIENLENVYLAGGEPMLMKENFEFLKLLKEKNPECTVRVNTNLSTTQTGIFELLCDFENVHWTVSIEAIEKEYEYIRHLGKWSDFTKNLDVLTTLKHKISFNMLHFILNYKSIHDCVDFLQSKGFHDNSFIIGPVSGPSWLNIMNLPEKMLDSIKEKLQEKLDGNPQGYLKNSYQNLLKYYTDTQWQKNMKGFYYNIGKMDQRRKLDSKNVFHDLFMELDLHELD
tara:strand:- start:1932 stop:3101 length:1170 start_codon:yes stop_codon:yes gene_type:complete